MNILIGGVTGGVKPPRIFAVPLFFFNIPNLNSADYPLIPGFPMIMGFILPVLTVRNPNP